MSVVEGSDSEREISAGGPEGLKDAFRSEVGGDRIEDYDIKDFSVEGRSPFPDPLVNLLTEYLDTDPDVELTLTLEYNIWDDADPDGRVQNGWGEEVILAILKGSSEDDVKKDLDSAVSSVEEVSIEYDEAYGQSYLAVMGPETAFE
ncbi:MAG: hypothetical protein ABEJ93_04475 [Candidatus Nanohalobium sp.]